MGRAATCKHTGSMTTAIHDERSKKQLKMDSEENAGKMDSELAELRILHLADSALPVGGLAHSFGLESLVSAELLGVRELPEFLRTFLEEAGFVEAVFCREGLRLASGLTLEHFAHDWKELNERLSAMKPARESRAGSGSLGRNFLATVSGLGDFAILTEALRVSKGLPESIHYSLAFGLASGTLGLVEDRAVLAFLHTSVASLVSACQRLLPLGQNAATRILWDLKPAIVEAMRRSCGCTLDDASGFMPLLDWGTMEHPALATRLFIS
jgi:urease accessory protein